MNNKYLVLVLAAFLLVGTVSAVDWADAGGCWTATDGADSLVMWNATVSNMWTSPTGVTSVWYLVVAGGGGASDGKKGQGNGGGGGAGGLLNGTLSITSETNYAITVGSGGANGTRGVNGTNSSFSIIAAKGGGAGGGSNEIGYIALSGGSGGGGGGAASISGNGANGTAGQGYAGGNGQGSGNYEGGGGGGAGEIGSTDGLGYGGDGTQISITGTNTYYAGGGSGGNSNTQILGGDGGGGAGAGHISGVSTQGTDGLGGGGGGGTYDVGIQGNRGGNGIVIIRYTTPTGSNPPIPSFTSNVTSGYSPLVVQFNDTSITTPTAWNWSYQGISGGNTTQTWWSQIQNATGIFTTGNYTIHLNVTNSSGFATTASNYWINVTAPSITAAFSGTPLGGIAGTTVTFSDASTGYAADNWTWNFGDGNTSTLQNPTNEYGYNGNFNVNLTIYNASAGFDSELKTGYVVISDSGGLSGWNRQDILMDQIYTVTFNVKDSSTYNGIPGAIVQLSNGDNTTTDLFGVATFSMNYSAIVVQVGATGYYSRTISYVVDRDRDETIYLTAVAASSNVTPQTMTYYTPWQVRIRIADFYGNPLPGTNVTANYIASTLPSTNISWLITAYGVQAATAAQMLDSGVAMTGVTDDNGGLSFSMFKSIQYSLLITNITSGVSATKNLYPSDQEYLIRVPIAGQQAVNNTLSAMASTSLPVYQLNATAYNLSVIYRDTSGLTDKVLFIVKYRNGTVLNSEDLGNPGTGTVVGNYTVNNIGIGTEILWSYNARRAGT